MPPGLIYQIALYFLSSTIVLECRIFSADQMSPQYNDEYPTLYDDDYNNVNIEEIYDNAIDRQEDVTQDKPFRYPLRMPSVSPKQKDTYLCYSYDFTQSPQDGYIVGFEPNATMAIAHHILLYGCTEPGHEPGVVWACGEMSGNAGNQYPRGRTCKSGPQTVYAWARDAPELELPEDVGFKIGRNSEVRYIVLQVHYANVDKFINGGTDSSGITLKLTSKPMPKLAGVYLLGTGGIVANGKSHLQAACRIKQPGLKMHPFRFRTHTHTHGKLVSGYVIKNKKWIEIGEHDPLKPQMFYEVKNKSLVVENGDILAAECVMENNDGHPVPIGATHKDEMCNFYMMYWSMAPEISNDKYCFTAGPPMYKWKYDPKIPNPPAE